MTVSVDAGLRPSSLPTTARRPGIRVVVGDDDLLMRTGLARILERPGQTVVGVAGDPDDLLDLVREHDPDLVVVDFRSRPTRPYEAIRAAERVRRERPGTGIVVLAEQVELDRSTALLASGPGIGYLLKTRVEDIDDFFDALRRVARGGCILDPALLHELMTARRRDDPLSVLSRRELDVLGLMAEGRSNLGIAHGLWLAEGTVEKHVRSILCKLALDDRPSDHRRVLAVIAYLRTTWQVPEVIRAGGQDHQNV